MLGVFYTYTEEYKHNEWFLKTTKLYDMYKIKLHKTSNVGDPCNIDIFVMK